MFLPLRTDAPGYFQPFATVGLVLANALVLIALGGGGPPEGWALEFGRLRPLEWITHAFSHADVIHLAGNMVFLYVFGYVVESRLHWRRFLVLYFALAAADGLLAQVLFFGARGSAVGSSGVVFGLLVIASLWSPRTRVTCFWWVPFEMPLSAYVGMYVGMDIFYAVLDGFALAPTTLHLIGAGVGAVAGWYLPRTGYVLLADWDGLPPAFEPLPEPKPARAVAPAPAAVAEPAAPTRIDPGARARELLAAGDVEGALAILDEHRTPERREPPKLALLRAEILIRHRSRARQGLEVLRGLDRALLGGPDRRRADELAAEATTAIQRGDLELAE